VTVRTTIAVSDWDIAAGTTLIFETSNAGVCMVTLFEVFSPVDTASNVLASVPEAVPVKLKTPGPVAVNVHWKTCPELPFITAGATGSGPLISSGVPAPVIVNPHNILNPFTAAAPVLVTTMFTTIKPPISTVEGDPVIDAVRFAGVCTVTCVDSCGRDIILPIPESRPTAVTLKFDTPEPADL
jgi:hypothetical protein